MGLGEPIHLPSPNLPKALDVPQLYFKPPSARIPSFPPIVVPPSDLEAPEDVKEEGTNTEAPEPRKLEIPIIDIEMPLPSGEVLITAVTTAVVAVGTTTVAQSMFEPIKKKVQKQLQTQVNKWKEKRKKRKDSSKS
tara:strand:+ start:2472 stop:2879 length:408 start_codon:yes stop_codon:yes gene_type:complete